MIGIERAKATERDREKGGENKKGRKKMEKEKEWKVILKFPR